MVMAMAQLPRVEWNQNESVQQRANNVVHELILGKGTMAAICKTELKPEMRQIQHRDRTRKNTNHDRGRNRPTLSCPDRKESEHEN